jgi:glycosyltransferase involved in cell wall biosynthesis
MVVFVFTTVISRSQKNESAATWLLKKVFNDLSIPLVIAGKNPGSRLQKIAHQHQFTCLVSNPSQEEMQDMIAKAQINILPSFNTTGIKLKLLNALFNGRHCVVNQQTIEFTGLDTLCHIGAGETEFKEIIRNLFELPFGPEEVAAREKNAASTI